MVEHLHLPPFAVLIYEKTVLLLSRFLSLWKNGPCQYLLGKLNCNQKILQNVMKKIKKGLS